MLSTLRARLIVSHVLPLLIIIPLVGLALVYVLETRVLLPSLARQLTAQAVLVAELTRAHPEVWQDPAAAAGFVDRTGSLFPGQLMLLSPDGVVLASSDPADVTRPRPITGRIASSARPAGGRWKAQTRSDPWTLCRPGSWMTRSEKSWWCPAFSGA